MRGKAACTGATAGGSRITPAYAGKREVYMSANFRRQDHPRLCGEKPKYNGTFAIPQGSPPPMRGKVSAGLFKNFLGRITPAYAGKRHVGKVVELRS